MTPIPEKTNYDSLKKQKDDLINNIVSNFDDFDQEGRRTWNNISSRLFPAVRDLFSSLIETMEKNEKALLQIIEQQRKTISQQALDT